MAILSDALHDLGNDFSMRLAWFFDRRSKRSSDHKYSFGYRSFSLLGALVNSPVLILGSLFILSKAIPRLLNLEASGASNVAKNFRKTISQFLQSVPEEVEYMGESCNLREKA